MKETRRIFSCWLEYIALFQFSIEHKKGKHNIFADTLSRRQDYQDMVEDENEVEDVYAVLEAYDDPFEEELEPVPIYEPLRLHEIVELDQLRELQREDPDIAQALEWIKRDCGPTLEEGAKLSWIGLHYANLWPALVMSNGFWA